MYTSSIGRTLEVMFFLPFFFDLPKSLETALNFTLFWGISEGQKKGQKKHDLECAPYTTYTVLSFFDCCDDILVY